tara:strand:- start:341 stop:1153 length:813 start_codon:yes stop_codon:yes gene_type:complete
MNLLASYDYEFGHELFSFQGHVRHLSKEYEKITVHTKPDMYFLYEDFVTDFVSIKKRGPCPCNYDKHVSNASLTVKGMGIREEQEFIRYGKTVSEKYDVIVHARDLSAGFTPNLGADFYDLLFRNLSKDYRVAFIGSKEGALCPDGATDLRGTPLGRLADIIHSSKLVLGPSSGPIHFSSLCGTPHVTWGGYRLRTFFRYAHFWNPFKTICYILDNYSETLGYLKRRTKSVARGARGVFEQEHLNLIQIKDFHRPSNEELLSTVKEALGD